MTTATSGNDAASAVIATLPTGLLIDGAWREARDGGTLSVENPANAIELARIADAGLADARDAVAAATRAQPSWSATSSQERSETLRRAYELVMDQTDDLAHLITAEMGKPVGEAAGEVRYAAEFFRWFAEQATHIEGSYAAAPDGRTRMLVMRRPVGPCLLITPWNFPLAMGARKIAPALAAGCTVVFKPAPQTPLTSLALGTILQDAGVPAGVVNIITTSRAEHLVAPIMAEGQLRKVSFTGSTQVGKLLLAQAASTVMRTSMELGGNAAFVVFDDADLDTAVDAAFAAKMRNMGEACTAANRIYVQRGIAAEFTARLAARMGGLVVGDGTMDGVQVGPLIDEPSLQKVTQLVDDAVARGAHVEARASVPHGPGYFYPPTVLSGVPAEADMLQTEIFGPVAALITFDTEDEVVELANNTPWGLVDFVATSDLSRGLRLSEQLEVGMVGINTGIVSNPAAPFGGIKQSGLGREGGRVGVDEFLEYRYVAIPIS